MSSAKEDTLLSFLNWYVSRDFTDVLFHSLFHQTKSALIIIIIIIIFIIISLYTAERKKQKYRELTQQLKNDYDKVNFVNLSISALGIYDKSTTDFIDMMKTLKFDKRSRNYMIKKITSIAIRTSYYIFCRRNIEWTDLELMTLWYCCFEAFFSSLPSSHCKLPKI